MLALLRLVVLRHATERPGRALLTALGVMLGVTLYVAVALVNRATTGCTTMAEPELVKMIAWFRSSRHPCYALLPAEEYEKKWRAWDLPPPDKTQSLR